METLVRISTWMSIALLATGMVVWSIAPGDVGLLVLHVGLVLLMATPVTRLVGVLVEEIRAREWRFVALGVAVLVLLCGSVLISWL